MTKIEMVHFLQKDFETMFPDSNRATRVQFHSMVSDLDEASLEILVNEIKKRNEVNK